MRYETYDRIRRERNEQGLKGLIIIIFQIHIRQNMKCGEMKLYLLHCKIYVVSKRKKKRVKSEKRKRNRESVRGARIEEKKKGARIIF